MVKVQLVRLDAMTPRQLYKSGLTHWGVREIEHFYHDGFEYWSYPTDCFYKQSDQELEDAVLVGSLEDVK